MTLASIHPTDIAAHAGNRSVRKKEVTAEMEFDPEAVAMDAVHRLRRQVRIGGEEGRRSGLRDCPYGTRQG